MYKFDICHRLFQHLVAGGPVRAARRRQAGFTMPELVTTMAIGAVLTAVGVPTYRYVTNSSRVSSEINGLLGDLQYARAEAIKEGQTVTVCASTDGATCSGAATWQTGWIVYSDSNGNQAVDAGEPIRRVQPTFRTTDTLDGGLLAAVTFNRNGFAVGLAGNSTFTLHDASNSAVWTRCVLITQVGRMQTELSGVGACL